MLYKYFLYNEFYIIIEDKFIEFFEKQDRIIEDNFIKKS